MTKYTIGIYFNEDLTEVALILKNRPKWQEGRYNFPGGHVEENEFGVECISREFEEECNIKTKSEDWTSIGLIINPEVYDVEIFTSRHNPLRGELKTMEDQPVQWFNLNSLPENMISNLRWLIPFALNFWKQGNTDTLVQGIFYYQ